MYVALAAAAVAQPAAADAAASLAVAAADAAASLAVAAAALVTTARLQDGRWRRLPWQYVRHHKRPPVPGMDKSNAARALTHAEQLPVQRSG